MLIGITSITKEEVAGPIPASGIMNTIKLLNEQNLIDYPKNCQYPGCDKPATDIAEDRDRNVVDFYCDAHADQTVDSGRPEYRVSCPNCGCGFGVN